MNHSSLIEAVQAGDLAAVQERLDAGEDVNQRDIHQKTPLFHRWFEKQGRLYSYQAGEHVFRRGGSRTAPT